jgi:hypothetical protein
MQLYDLEVQTIGGETRWLSGYSRRDVNGLIAPPRGLQTDELFIPWTSVLLVQIHEQREQA